MLTREQTATPSSGITVTRDVALIRASIDTAQYPNALEELLAALASNHVSIELLQLAPGRVRFVCSASNAQAAMSAADAAGFGATIVAPCAKIAVTGSEIPETPGIVLSLMRGMRDGNVELLHLADSGAILSLVVRERHSAAAEAIVATIAGPALRGRYEFIFDDTRSLVRIDGRDVRLGTRQAALLKYLIDNAGETLTTEQIAQAVFPGNDSDSAAVRVHVHNLRRKIERDPEAPRHVITVPSRGYMFEI